MRIPFLFTASLSTFLALVGCNSAATDKPAPPAGGPAAGQPGDKPASAATGAPGDKSAVPAPAAGGPTQQVDLRFVPKEAFAAMVAYPRRVLTSGALDKLDFTAPFADMEKHLGFSPRDTSQLVSFAILTPGDGPQAEPNFTGGLEVVLSKPHTGPALVKQILERFTPEEAEVDGKKYFRPAKDPAKPAGKTVQCISIIDDHTFLVADEATLKLMLTAKNTKSPLTDLIGKLDPHADLAVLVTNPDEIRKMIDEQMKSGAAPPQLAPYAALPDLLDATTLSVATTPEISIHWSLQARDDVGAKKLADMITQAGQTAQGFVKLLHQLAESQPPQLRPAADYAITLATKLAAGIKPTQTGNQVTLDIGGLGTLDDLATKILAPALDSARQAAEQAARLNGLKALSLGLLSFENANGKFPTAAILSKDGKPLLSWRVAVLPFIGQDDLYKKFHLDEPWNSPNNQPLISQMPKLFLSAGAQNPEEGRTRFLVPTGKNTLFDGTEGVTMAQVTDGMSNTILIVEAGQDKGVFWTKPEDLTLDPANPAAGLGQISSDGFVAAFADGRVQVLKKEIDGETLLRLLIRNDGKPIDPSKF